MAAGPIPWDKIEKWCEVKGLDREAADVLTAVIRTVDNERAAAAEAKHRLEELSGKGRER